MIKLSVIIPSYRDPLLHKTIDSLLTQSGLGDQLEVIPVCDGYWPEKPIVDDSRVRIVHLGANRGMRGAINAGVAVARGEYIMRTDEHATFGNNYDLVLTSQCEPSWILTAKRYFLNPVEWAVMDIPPVRHEKLVIQDCGNGVKKFAGQRWKSRDEEYKDVMVSETFAMQGSQWCMKHDWWDKVIVELDTEHYGQLIQDSTEMIFRTWQAGGKLMSTQSTWYAHKHRSFPRTHNSGTPENPANCDKGYKYALDTWGKYYEEVIVPRQEGRYA